MQTTDVDAYMFIVFIHYVWDITQVGNSEGHGDANIDCMDVDDDVYEIEKTDDSDWDETENRISVSFTQKP